MKEEQQRLAEELLFSEQKPPSFAKSLYFGDFDAAHVLPYPGEADAQVSAFLAKVEQFSKEKIDPDWIDRHATIPEEVKQGLKNLGVMGMTVPAEYGGLGMSQYAYCRVTEILARRCASTTLYVNVHQSIGMRALLLFGTAEQRKKWLPAMASAEKIGAFSLTEPNAGSDANGIETIAFFDQEKGVYRINGRKQWTTNGSIAGVLTVMAKVDGKVTAFLVTPDMPGFSVAAKSLEKVGMRGTWTANLVFNNLEVPPENILGPLGGGLKVCLTVLDYGRTTFGALCTGVAKVCMERALEHSRTRYQFGQPLASFALVKKKITMIAALTYAMDATTYLTAGLIDAGVEDIMLESAMLKVFTSDSLWTIIYETMQIFGGRSFFTDEPFERMMRDARLNMIGEGANEVMRAFIGAVGMRDVGMELKEGKFLGLLRCLWAPRVPIQSPQLQEEAKQLGKMIRRFGFAIVKALGRYREGIIDQQLVLERIANSAIALYTTTAVLSKLDRGEDSDLSVGKFYCRHALGLAQEALGHLFDKDDRVIETVSDELTGCS